MKQVFKVGYDLKGDKAHHMVEATMDSYDPQGAQKFVMDEFKNQRIVRALVLIDCIELSKLYPENPSVV